MIVRKAALAFVLTALGLPHSGAAQSEEPLQPPLSLPQTLRGTVVVPLSERPAVAADTLPELFLVLVACWTAPTGLERLEDVQITARMSLRQDGTLVGPPRITFAAGAPTAGSRNLLVRVTLGAIRRCMPAHITPALGRAIAGRPLALRFIYRGPDR
ncbi:hypothetical protein [Methylobacterium planeticum]|uniref:hypothetical protein n=1 Tax=Methylobacterium planeticum TaxID=2615211 RepID=UPI001FF04465|nr:hypothetical protein [Methylobacterium planeticum]